MLPASEFSIAMTASGTLRRATFSKASSNVTQGVGRMFCPKIWYAARWLNAPSSPWKATAVPAGTRSLLRALLMKIAPRPLRQSVLEPGLQTRRFRLPFLRPGEGPACDTLVQHSVDGFRDSRSQVGPPEGHFKHHGHAADGSDGIREV